MGNTFKPIDNPSKLTDKDCERLKITAEQCNALREVLGLAPKGNVTTEVQQKFADQGFSKKFIKLLAGTDIIKEASRPRVRWLFSPMEYIAGMWGLLKMMLGKDSAQQSQAKRFIETIARGLEDEDPMVRYRAAGALGKWGPKAKGAVPLLTKRLEYEVEELKKEKDKEPKDKDEFEKVWYDRAAVAWALGKMGPAAQPAIKVLKYMAENDPIGYCRETAQRALRKIKGQCKPADISGSRTLPAKSNHTRIGRFIDEETLDENNHNLPRAPMLTQVRRRRLQRLKEQKKLTPPHPPPPPWASVPRMPPPVFVNNRGINRIERKTDRNKTEGR